MIKSWQPRTAENILHRFEVDLFPVLGTVPIADVKVPKVLKAIRAVEERGALKVAKRLTSDCSRVFKYAIRCELTERNPAALLGEVLEPREKGHFAAIGADELPAFLRALYANEACMGLSDRRGSAAPSGDQRLVHLFCCEQDRIRQSFPFPPACYPNALDAALCCLKRLN